MCNFYSLAASAKPQGCEFTFTVNLESSQIDSLQGAEIALFKKTEPESFGKLYVPFILSKLASSSFYATNLAEGFISGSCSGWQTFNISMISSILSSGETTFNILLAVFKSNNGVAFNPMTCAEIKSVFVIDKYANINNFFGDSSKPPSTTESTTETPTEEKPKDTTTEAKKEENNSSVDTPNETEVKKEEEGGSGEGTTEEEPTTPTVENMLAKQYVPVIAFFSDAVSSTSLFKRSVDDVVNNNTTNKDPVSTEEEEMLDDGNDQASGADCRRLENKIKLSDIDPSIVKPEIVDIGKCSSSTETMQCLPSTTVPVHILKKDQELSTITIDYFHQDLILACEPHFVPTQASTADQASTTTL